MSIEELDKLLKTLKAGKKRLPFARACIQRLRQDKSIVAIKQCEFLECELDEYFKLEERLYKVMNDVLNEDERVLLVSYYVQGLSPDKIALDMYICRSTVFRWLRVIKQKIATNWTASI